MKLFVQSVRSFIWLPLKVAGNMCKDMTDIQREISRKKETTLHIAAAANLTAENNAGNPALTYAAAAGNVNIAKAMLKRNIQLPNLGRMKPLYTAASLGHSRMVDWLYSDTKKSDANTKTTQRCVIKEEIEILGEKPLPPPFKRSIIH